VRAKGAEGNSTRQRALQQRELVERNAQEVARQTRDQRECMREDGEQRLDPAES
jgi:hypothetical protein